VGAFISVYSGRPATDASKPATPKDYFDVVVEQESLRRKWDVFFKSMDVVIAPVAPTAAFPLFDEPEASKRKLLINGREVPYEVAMAAWFPLAGVSRLPATAVPIGRTISGLPIGLQLIGPYLEDRTTIALSGLISTEFGPGFIAPPGFF
jgi:amidase